MKHIKTLNTKSLQNTMKKGGCGECQTSCQSACKTSCTVGNQSCENTKEEISRLYDAWNIQAAVQKPLLAFCYIAYQELIRWINCDYIVYRSRRCCCARKEEGEQISDSSV